MAVVPFVPRPSKHSSGGFDGTRALQTWGAAPADNTNGVIAYILKRYHQVHRAELPGLLVLAREFEAAPRECSGALPGFANFLAGIGDSRAAHEPC